MRNIRRNLYLEVSKEQIERLNRDIELDKKNLIKLSHNAFKYAVNTWLREIAKRIRKETNLKKDFLDARIRSTVSKKKNYAKIFNGLNPVNIIYWNARVSKRGISYGKSGSKKINTKAWVGRARNGGKIAYERKSNGKKFRPDFGVNKGKLIEAFGLANAEIDNIITPILETEITKFYTVYSQKFDNEVSKYLKRQLRKQGIK